MRYSGKRSYDTTKCEEEGGLHPAGPFLCHAWGGSSTKVGQLVFWHVAAAASTAVKKVRCTEETGPPEVGPFCNKDGASARLQGVMICDCSPSSVSSPGRKDEEVAKGKDVKRKKHRICGTLLCID